MQQHEIRRPAAPSEMTRYAEILHLAFGKTPAYYEEFANDLVTDDVRIALRGTDVDGGLVCLSTHQWFAGRKVPMTGIAAVAVAPEHRGRGVGRALMESTLRELRDVGTALSTLYPATVSLYRKCGYELAGQHLRAVLYPRQIDVRERDAVTRPADESDNAIIEQVYERHASGQQGFVARTPYFWRRIRRPNGQPTRAFVIEHRGRPEGYLHYLVESTDPHVQVMHLLDCVALTPTACRALLAFLATHHTLVQEIHWRCLPLDPIFMHLAEPAFTTRQAICWMTRIVDVAAALTARGYASQVHGEVELEVADDVLADNNGRFTLAVADGKARVEPGGRGRVRIDIRGLAALYTSQLGAAHLRCAGLLEAGAREAAVLDAVFAGPCPAMTDQF